MSDGLYSTRLRWQAHGHGGGGSGCALRFGVRVPLAAAPVLGGQPVYHVDYVPEIGLKEVRVRACDSIRDMDPGEVGDADALILTLCGGAA